MKKQTGSKGVKKDKGNGKGAKSIKNLNRKTLEKRNSFGHKIGTGAAKMDELIERGGTLADITAVMLKDHPNFTRGQLTSHIKHLQKDRGAKIEIKDGIVALIK